METEEDIWYENAVKQDAKISKSEVDFFKRLRMNNFKIIEDYLLQNKEAVMTRMDMRKQDSCFEIEFTFAGKHENVLTVMVTKQELIDQFARLISLK